VLCIWTRDAFFSTGYTCAEPLH